MHLSWSLLDCINNTSLHSIALLPALFFQVLLLQKPHAKSKANKDHISCLECRLVLWHAGDFSVLVKVGKCIQDHLQSFIHKSGRRIVAHAFDCLMSMGKVFVAIKLLSVDAKDGVLSLESQISCGLDKAGCPASESVKDILVDKHPPATEAVPEMLLSSDNIDVPSFLFERLTGSWLLSILMVLLIHLVWMPIPGVGYAHLLDVL